MHTDGSVNSVLMQDRCLSHVGLIDQTGKECKRRGGRVSAGSFIALLSFSPAPVASPTPPTAPDVLPNLYIPFNRVSRHVSSAV